jgi:hypothetical protein
LAEASGSGTISAMCRILPMVILAMAVAYR